MQNLAPQQSVFVGKFLVIFECVKLFKKVRTKQKKKRDKSNIWLLKENFLRKNIFGTTEKEISQLFSPNTKTYDDRTTRSRPPCEELKVVFHGL